MAYKYLLLLVLLPKTAIAQMKNTVMYVFQAWKALWIGKQQVYYWEAPVAYVEFEFVYSLQYYRKPLP